VIAPVVLVSTAYSPCSSGSIMANGHRTHFGAVAQNAWPLGTRITIHPGFAGRHRFVVEDRIGYGSELDIWTSSCSGALAWGRRSVRVTLGWRRQVRRGFVVRHRYVA
jgi:3D (Asp-Asp-Asp) domain-containing protein